MTLRKFVHGEMPRWGVLLVLDILMSLIIALPPQATVEGFLFLDFTSTQINCSQYCTCQSRDIDVEMRQHRHNHMVYMGVKYRPELQYGPNSEYMDFLGLFGAMVRRVIEVSCRLSDGQTHRVSHLLNGVEKIQHAALDVKCQSHEDLILDMMPWEVDFNVFVTDSCRLLPADVQKGLVIPMNMWILDIHKGGAGLMNLMDMKYMMNTVALSVSDSQTTTIPPHWLERYLISAALVSLQYDGLESFDCRMLFTRLLDTLNLAHNEIVRFPDCLLKSSTARVRYLSLSHNLISDLTPLYEKPNDNEPTDIKIINLSFNDIRSLECLRAIPSLTVLDLSHNFIREINDIAFSKNSQIKTLYLGYNRIHKLGFSAFSRNTGLSQLDLSHNSLANVLTDQFPNTQNSLSIDVRKNKFAVPPFQDCGSKKFPIRKTTVLAAENPFICDCNTMPYERCLARLRENNDVNDMNNSLPVNMFEDLDKLTCIDPSPVAGQLIKDLMFNTECIIKDDCPSSCDCILKDTQNLLVNCSSRRLLEMPDSIPSFDNATVVLKLDHNPMQMLSYRSYLHSLSELYMDNCLLSSVTPTAIAALQNVRILTLHNNLLQKLPASTRNITLNLASNVTLHNNRWQCSCDSLWLPRWITKHRAVLWAPGNILCNYLRKPVEDFTDSDVNCSNPSSYLEVILAVCLALASLVSTFALVVYYRTEINVLIYSKFGIRLGSTLAYGDSFSPYDAFVSYSQNNYKWVVDTLVPRLENSPKKYRLCLHYRDFPAGESVVDNIPWAIHLSRCSILVLSNDFVKKEWCIMELRAAFQRLLLVANKLIIIATEDIDLSQLSPDLRAYMNTHEYLKVGESNFWKKLELLLPPKRLFDPGDLQSYGNVLEGDEVKAASDQAGGDYEQLEHNMGADLTSSTLPDIPDRTNHRSGALSPRSKQ